MIFILCIVITLSVLRTVMFVQDGGKDWRNRLAFGVAINAAVWGAALITYLKGYW